MQSSTSLLRTLGLSEISKNQHGSCPLHPHEPGYPTLFHVLAHQSSYFRCHHCGFVGTAYMLAEALDPDRFHQGGCRVAPVAASVVAPEEVYRRQTAWIKWWDAAQAQLTNDAGLKATLIDQMGVPRNLLPQLAALGAVPPDPPKNLRSAGLKLDTYVGYLALAYFDGPFLARIAIYHPRNRSYVTTFTVDDSAPGLFLDRQLRWEKPVTKLFVCAKELSALLLLGKLYHQSARHQYNVAVPSAPEALLGLPELSHVVLVGDDSHPPDLRIANAFFNVLAPADIDLSVVTLPGDMRDQSPGRLPELLDTGLPFTIWAAEYLQTCANLSMATAHAELQQVAPGPEVLNMLARASHDAGYPALEELLRSSPQAEMAVDVGLYQFRQTTAGYFYRNHEDHNWTQLTNYTVAVDAWLPREKLHCRFIGAVHIGNQCHPIVADSPNSRRDLSHAVLAGLQDVTSYPAPLCDYTRPPVAWLSILQRLYPNRPVRQPVTQLGIQGRAFYTTNVRVDAAGSATAAGEVVVAPRVTKMYAGLGSVQYDSRFATLRAWLTAPDALTRSMTAVVCHWLFNVLRSHLPRAPSNSAGYTHLLLRSTKPGRGSKRGVCQVLEHMCAIYGGGNKYFVQPIVFQRAVREVPGLLSVTSLPQGSDLLVPAKLNSLGTEAILDLLFHSAAPLLLEPVTDGPCNALNSLPYVYTLCVHSRAPRGLSNTELAAMAADLPAVAMALHRYLQTTPLEQAQATPAETVWRLLLDFFGMSNASAAGLPAIQATVPAPQYEQCLQLLRSRLLPGPLSRHVATSRAEYLVRAKEENSPYLGYWGKKGDIRFRLTAVLAALNEDGVAAGMPRLPRREVVATTSAWREHFNVTVNAGSAYLQTSPGQWPDWLQDMVTAESTQ